MKHYDLAIIGSGPGGYVAGLYASGRKLKTCIIEKSLVGGTCLNRGCIPTKSLINSASILNILRASQDKGLEVKGFGINFEKMSSRKDETVLRLRTGIETLLRANKIDLINGAAAFAGDHTLHVEGCGDVSADHIIIASGSSPQALPGIDIDEEEILSSDGLLSVTKIPKSILVIGGGVIGCEFASLFNILGSKVVMIEFMDRLIPGQSRELSKKLEGAFKKRGMEICLQAEVKNCKKESGKVITTLSGGRTVETEKVLVAVGRKPYTESLHPERAGVRMENNRIAIDHNLRTDAGHIYAIGDCVKGPLLAHKASYDAYIACDNILGNQKIADYSNIPSLIWTHPEVASVGLNEEDAKKANNDLRIAKFPYLASGKAYLSGSYEGYIKIMGNSKGEIIGVEIMGDGACDLIAEAALARSAGITIGDWGSVVHGHPTLSEMFHEACGIFLGAPIHSVQP